ncbi:MAG: hypothetical protein WCT77_09295, partial [Bacteroidota bacterium]
MISLSNKHIKFKKLETKSLLPRLRVVSGYLIIAFIAFEIRGFILYDPIIPYTWPLKITEFMVAHTTFNNPMVPPQKCEDFKTVVRIMG